MQRGDHHAEDAAEGFAAVMHVGELECVEHIDDILKHKEVELLEV